MVFEISPVCHVYQVLSREYPDPSIYYLIIKISDYSHSDEMRKKWTALVIQQVISFKKALISHADNAFCEESRDNIRDLIQVIDRLIFETNVRLYTYTSDENEDCVKMLTSLITEFNNFKTFLINWIENIINHSIDTINTIDNMDNS